MFNQIGDRKRVVRGICFYTGTTKFNSDKCWLSKMSVFNLVSISSCSPIVEFTVQDITKGTILLEDRPCN